MKLETKVKKLIELREDILKDSKKWKGPNCPLKQFEGNEYSFHISHYCLSQAFTGLGCWKWECPFCKEEFQE